MKQNWRKWILCGALALACAESVALWQNGRGKYLRYVSAPLKDGTRYTFLYPACLPIVKESRTHVLIKSAPQIPSVRDKALVWLGWPQDSIFNRFNPGEVSIYTYPSSEGNSRSYSPTNYNSVTILNDSRCKVCFFAAHRKLGDQDEAFEREDKVLSDSFKILPPGAPIPTATS